LPDFEQQALFLEIVYLFLIHWQDGRTSLAWASKDGQTAVVSELIAAGADINKASNVSGLSVMALQLLLFHALLQQHNDGDAFFHGIFPS